MNISLLKKIRAIKVPATSRNSVAVGSGRYNHWLWFDTEITRSRKVYNGTIRDRLKLGVEYSTDQRPMPRDGGTIPAGGWKTTYLTGKKCVTWTWA